MREAPRGKVRFVQSPRCDLDYVNNIRTDCATGWKRRDNFPKGTLLRNELQYPTITACRQNTSLPPTRPAPAPPREPQSDGSGSDGCSGSLR